MKRHAYLILAHACPEQLRKLLSLLDDGRNSIFVHIDAKAGFGGEVLEGACRYSDVHLVEPRLKVSWGGVSIMRATIAMLEAAASVGQFDYYHLLSGMDLPIKGQDEIHAFFDERPGREFLRLWPTDEARAVRFRYYIPFPEAGNNFMLRLLNNAFRGVEMLFGARINKGIDFRFSAQWFSIDDAFARYVISQRDFLERVFCHTGTPDEVFMSTLLVNSPFKDALYDDTIYLERSPRRQEGVGNMRFTDWTRGKSVRHPWVFTDDDYDMLMGASGFWARKFDERVDGKIIDRICAALREP